MIRGVYTSASGMVASQQWMDVTSVNISSNELTAYKRQTATFAPLLELALMQLPGNAEGGGARPIGVSNLGVRLDAVVKDFAQGDITYTGRDKDLALSGEGFFVVARNEDLFYTRAGSFSINEEGFLVTLSGDYVLGENGRIELTGKPQLSFDRDGLIFADGVLVDRLRFAFFENHNALRPVGESLFVLADGFEESAPGKVLIAQAYLERSNVDFAREMANIVLASTLYSANQRMAGAHDSLLEKAVNQVGVVR